ncbi:MAG: hypothetical protein FWF22_10500 [Treponema sp.]|nr:hypothetical protein [Treponema sp.]
MDKITVNEKSILRELAKRYAEIAADKSNTERIARIRKINGLTPQRPPVWIDEIPWHEMDIDGQLTLQCRNPQARNMEFFFRSALFRWKYFQADMVAEDTYYIQKSFDSTGFGLAVNEQILSTDQNNRIVSHHFVDQLDSEDKLEQLSLPVVTARPDKDNEELMFANEILTDILPVKLRGHGIFYSIWDRICHYRGVEPILYDMVDRPQLLHLTISRFCELYSSLYLQMEKLGLVDYNLKTLHCTPPYCNDLPAPDFSGVPRLKDVWFRGASQIFATVSPAALQEFDLDYTEKFMEKCRLVYYGCCEPLDNKIHLLKRVPNMRKIGVSPWANVRSCAEQIGPDYVYSRKPNPAHVVGIFNADEVKKETSMVLEACLEFKCPLEFTLKDISTVSYKPQNLIEWNRTVQETIDKYYR